MTYAEDDFLMISSIQHFIFCKRQWALIHLEELWTENYHTILGEIMHENAHDPYLAEKRNDTIVIRALPVSSKRLGLSGNATWLNFRNRRTEFVSMGIAEPIRFIRLSIKKVNQKLGKKTLCS